MEGEIDNLSLISGNVLKRLGEKIFS